MVLAMMSWANASRSLSWWMAARASSRAVVALWAFCRRTWSRRGAPPRPPSRGPSKRGPRSCGASWSGAAMSLPSTNTSARMARLTGIAPRAAVCARAEILAEGAPTSWLAITGTEVLPVGTGSLLVARAPVVLAESAGLAVLAETTRLAVLAVAARLAPFAEVARLPVAGAAVILAETTWLAVFAEPAGFASPAEVAGLAAGTRSAVLPRAPLGVAIALACSVVGSSLVVGSMIVMHGTMFLPRPAARGRRRRRNGRPWPACRPVSLRLLPRPPRRSREAVGSR